MAILRRKKTKPAKISTQPVVTAPKSPTPSKSRKEKRQDRRNARQEKRQERREERQDRRQERREHRRTTGLIALWGRKKPTRVETTVNYALPVQTLSSQPSIQSVNAVTPNQPTIPVSNVVVQNNNYANANPNGISVFRPEIISTLDFKPVFENTSEMVLGSNTVTNNILQFFNNQYQSSFLRENTLKELLKKIKESSSTEQQYNTLIKEFNLQLTNLDNIILFYSNLVGKINDVKLSLDIKKIPSSFYKDITLQQFFEKYMQFSQEEYTSFTNTKIFNQFIFDLRNVLENYSNSLLNLTDFDRIDNKDPIKLDKTFELSNGFTFKPSSISSPVVILPNASNNVAFTNFINSLPANPDDKIKLLCNFLSKELRVSKALGRQDIQKDLLARFNQPDNNNPFDNMFGNIGDTIFDEPVGEGNSLANLSYLKTNDSFVVLPFENLVVDYQKINNLNIIYIPGASYFADSILEYNNGFNIKPFTDFSDKFSSSVLGAANLINKIFEFDTTSSKLTQTEIYDYYLFSLKQSFSKLINSSLINKDQAIASALVKLSNTDTILKNHLFDFCLLLGIVSSNSNNQKPIFQKLIEELKTLNSLYSFKDKNETISLEGQTFNLRPYVEELAGIIENRIFFLLYGVDYRSIPREETQRRFRSLRDINFWDRSLRIGPELQNIQTSINNITAYGNIQEGFLLSLNYGDIKTSLINAVYTTTNTDSTFIKEFIDVVTQFDQAASVGTNALYFMNDGSNRTRFNFIVPSYLLLVIFETFCSLTDKYISSDFSKTSDSKNIIVKLNTNSNFVISDFISIINSQKYNEQFKQESTPSLISNLLSNQQTKVSLVRSRESSLNDPINYNSFGVRTTNRARQIKPLFKNAITTTVGVSNLFLTSQLLQYGTTLKSNRDKLNDEDTYIKDSIKVMNAMNSRITNSKTNVISTFSQQAIQSFILKNNITTEELKILSNESQLRSSVWILDKYKQNYIDSVDTDQKEFVSKFIPEYIKNTLYLFLKQSKYLSRNANNKVKILSFGIPNGLSKQLIDQVQIKNDSKTSNALLGSKEYDVVKVKLYKRDYRFEDIIFKPKEYYFDLSIFSDQFSNYPRMSFEDNWNNFIQNSFLKDYENITSKARIGFFDIVNNQDYGFLTNEQKTSIVVNHLESIFLSLYVELLTGIVIDEETFTVNPVSLLGNYNQAVYNLLITYLKSEKGIIVNSNTSMKDILLSDVFDDETKDILSLASFGNLLFQPDAIRKKVLGTKIFDRVFNISFNIDDFEIDVTNTLSTEAGKSSFEKAKIQNGIVSNAANNKLFINPRGTNDIVFEDYYITIETMLSK